MFINNVLLEHNLFSIILIELSKCKRPYGQQKLKYLLTGPLQIRLAGA